MIIGGRNRARELTGCCAGPAAGEVVKGDVVIVRYEGPKGGPGMQEMLALTGALQGRGMGNDVAFITDGRFSGATHGICAPGVRSMYPRSLHLP